MQQTTVEVLFATDIIGNPYSSYQGRQVFKQMLKNKNHSTLFTIKNILLHTYCIKPYSEKQMKLKDNLFYRVLPKCQGIQSCEKRKKNKQKNTIYLA